MYFTFAGPVSHAGKVLGAGPATVTPKRGVTAFTSSPAFFSASTDEGSVFSVTSYRVPLSLNFIAKPVFANCAGLTDA